MIEGARRVRYVYERVISFNNLRIQVYISVKVMDVCAVTELHRVPIIRRGRYTLWPVRWKNRYDLCLITRVK